MTTTLLKLSPENERNYQQLVSQLEASIGIFGIFITVCDDRNLRLKLITQYERELKDIAQCVRVKLDYKEPSLKSAVNSAIDKQNKINSSQIITVLGADNLSFVSPKQEHSQQDKFFGYLQWTREGLRNFSCPIVLWIDSHVLVNLTNKAPDFWSWRNGVFKFESEPAIADSTIINNRNYAIKIIEQDTVDTSSLSIEDIEQLIAETEAKRGKQEPTLVSLYHRLGNLYSDRLQQGKTKHYADELQRAIKSFCKAIELAKTLELYLNLIEIWKSLGSLYYYQAKYKKAIECWQKSLVVARQTGYLSGEASSLGNLGNVYYRLREYQTAIDYHQQSLTISQQIGSLNSEASSLYNLAIIFLESADFQQAKEHYQNARRLYREMNLQSDIEKCDRAIAELELSITESQESIETDT